MLIPKINLIFQQCRNDVNGKPIPGKILRFNYVNEFELETSYDKLIATGKIVLPVNKLFCNISDKIEDESTKSGNTINLDFTNIGLNDGNGGLLYNLITTTETIEAAAQDIGRNFNPTLGNRLLPTQATPPTDLITQVTNTSTIAGKEPMFKIGDMVTIQCVYYNPLTNAPEKDRLFYQEDCVISDLKLDENLEIGISNIGWFLKNVPMPNTVIKPGESFLDVLGLMLEIVIKKFPQQFKRIIGDSEKLTFIADVRDTTVKDINFNAQMVVVGNQSMAQFLDKIKHNYGLLSYFSTNIFYFPKIVQIPKVFSDKFLLPNQSKTYRFKGYESNGQIINGNIISNNLIYKTKSNLKLSAVVSNTFTDKEGGITKDGHAKTKKKKISIYMEYNGVDPDKPKVIVLYDNSGKKTDNDLNTIEGQTKEDGERRTLVDPSARNIEDLKHYGITQLKKYFYDGFSGDFETFGEPTTFIGDIIRLEDHSHPEKNGNYRVKGVKTTFGMGGFRQNITLDLKIFN